VIAPKKSGSAAGKRQSQNLESLYRMDGTEHITTGGQSSALPCLTHCGTLAFP